MPREIHKFDRTSGQVEDLFEELIASIGGTYNAEYGRRIQRIKIDGVPISQYYASD